MGQKNKPFTLSGTINVDSGMICFAPVGRNSDYPPDFNFSFVQVRKGKFIIQGNISHPMKVNLKVRLNGINIYISDGFFIENGKQTIICKSDTTSWNREIPDIHNSTMVEYLNQYRTPEYLSLDTLSDYYLGKKLKIEYLYRYAQKHPDSYVALWELSTELQGGYKRRLDSIFDLLSVRIKSSYAGRLIVNNIKHQALTDTGRIFPVIHVVDLEDKTHTLSFDTLKIRYVLIDFWFSHCGPCLSEFPEYIKITGTYQNKGFAMTGISRDSSQADIEAWKKVIHSESLNWLQYRTDEATINNLDINWFPWNFLLDRSGKIIAKNLDTKQLSDFLASHLN